MLPISRRGLPAILVFFALNLCLRPCIAQGDKRLTAAGILAHARASIGYDALAEQKYWKISGHAKAYDLDTTFTIRFAADGRVVEKIDGTLGETSGYNGKVAWQVDSTGMPLRLELGDLDAFRTAYGVITGRWLAPDSPFRVSLQSLKSNENEIVLDLTFDKSKKPASLTLDRTTWLPKSLRYQTVSNVQKWDYSDYREEAGVRFPHRLVHTESILPTIYQIETMQPEKEVADNVFVMPSVRPSDTSFQSDAPARIEAKRARTGHILVHPLVNGKDVGWFFLDTGAGGMVITPKVADALGMSALGKIAADGVGGTVQGRFRKGNTFQLGGMTVRNPSYIELDLDFLAPAFDVKIAGICGYDVFQRAVVEMDIPNGVVSLYDPAKYSLPKPGGTKWRELYLQERNACIECAFEGNRKAIFKLDTGDADTVTFHAPTVTRLKLLEGRETTATQNGGVGGMVAAREGKIGWFEVGDYRFQNPTVGFSLADKGAFTDVYTAGNVGATFLAPFRVVFDYPHKRIAFVKKTEQP
jgi:hypothetical protein